MSKNVPVRTSNGELFFVQVDEEPATPSVSQDDRALLGADPLTPRGMAMGSGESVLKEELFTKAVKVIRGVASELTDGLQKANPKPSEVELSLNLGFDAGGNVWLFKGGANAALRLTLKWRLT